MFRYFLIVIAFFVCTNILSQDSTKIYFEVFRDNNFLRSDSVLIKKNVSQSNPFDLLINKYDIIHLKKGDSLWMYLFYPIDIIKYSSFHNSVFDEPFISISEPPYLIEQYYTIGENVIRDKFSDSLNFQDTLLYNLREFPNNNLYCFLIQFDDVENNLIKLNISNFNLYPNPTRGFIYIDFDKKHFNKNIDINIFDINNQLIFETKEVFVEKKQIDLSWLENGIYFFKLELDDVIYQQKIIIQK